MEMGFGRQLAILAACALATPALAIGHVVLPESEFRVAPVKRQKKQLPLAAAGTRFRRGKRAQAKPAKRPNRMHISKRVRRKHRRAA